MNSILYFIILVTVPLSSVAQQNWVTCGLEGSICETKQYGLALVSYCDITNIPPNCIYIETSFANVECTYTIFGDPSYGIPKICKYLVISNTQKTNDGTWSLVTQEEYSPTLSWVNPSSFYTYRVRFCNFNRYSCYYQTGSSFLCSDSWFGDPDFGQVKYCDYRVEPAFGPEHIWSPIAQEGTIFSIPGSGASTWVRYGTGGLNNCRYQYRMLSGSNFVCGVLLFGADPAFGYLKTCYILVSPPLQATPIVGYWSLAGSQVNGQGNAITITQGYDSSSSQSTTTSITNGFSAALTQGFTYRIGLVEGSTQVSLGYSYSNEVDTTTGNSVDVSMGASCGCSCSSAVGTYGLWQWNVGWTQQANSQISSINVQTCQCVCKINQDYLNEPSCPYFLCNIANNCDTCITPSGTINDALTFLYIGCFPNSGVYTLASFAGTNSSMSPSLCQTWCSQQYGTQYFGLHNGNQCYCGSNSFSSGKSSATGCSVPCAGDDTQMCGDAMMNSVYLTGLNEISRIASSSEFTYVGCGESTIYRDMVPTVYTSTIMTPQRCYTMCMNNQNGYNFVYFGVYNANGCYCVGNYEPLNLGLSPDSCCDVPCAGNNNLYCGGSAPNSPCYSFYRINEPAKDLTFLASTSEIDAQEDNGQSLPTWLIPIVVVGGILIIVAVFVIVIFLLRKEAHNSPEVYHNLEEKL